MFPERNDGDSSLHKEPYESPNFSEHIHGDNHGPVRPPSRRFYYFMAVKDASSRFSHVRLLSIGNMSFPRLLTVIMLLRAQFPNFPINFIRMDNTTVLTSTTLIRYSESMADSFQIKIS